MGVGRRGEITGYLRLFCYIQGDVGWVTMRRKLRAYERDLQRDADADGYMFADWYLIVSSSILNGAGITV